jgi:hypothetical protein
MEKLLVKAVLIIGLIFPLSAISQSYRSCTEGAGCNYYSGGSSGSGSNLGAFTPGGVPNGGLGGMSADAIAQKRAAEEAARQQCRSNVYDAIYPTCEARVTEIHRADMNICSSSAVTGAVAAGVGGVALGIVAIAAAPVTLAVVGAASLVAIVGGGGLATYSSTACVNQTEWNRVDNLKACEASVKAGQSKACNF